jgi:hypothetical protein
MVPLLMPQPPKPVATQVFFAPTCSGPTYGTRSVEVLSCVDQLWVNSRPPKRSRVHAVSAAYRPVTSSRAPA